MGKQRANCVRGARRNYREILGDAKIPFEDWDMFLDGFQVQYFGARVNDRLEFDSWQLLQGELNRLVTLHAGRIDVYVRRKFDFGNQTGPATWYDTVIGLCNSESEMRGFDLLGHLRTQLREEFCNDIICRQSICVLRCEILFANNPTGVDVEEPGVGHTFSHSLGFAVEHVEAANDFGIRVSQQRKLDFVALGEVLQDGWTVVANTH